MTQSIKIFEEVANLLDSYETSGEDAMKICAAICIGVCIGTNHPKQIFIQFMSDAWNQYHEQSKEVDEHAVEERI